jgi:hypothetical protein
MSAVSPRSKSRVGRRLGIITQKSAKEESEAGGAKPLPQAPGFNGSAPIERDEQD